ncbi:MAG: MBL fold metallo-hydrolase [Clostridia bacterium]|nr:MBL fold metallo-hydrolase [Clostridia bacterium]
MMKKKSLLYIVVLIAVGLFSLLTPQEEKVGLSHQAGILQVAFLDVGQGDSAFMILPEGKTVLIDAGEQDAGTVITDFISSCGISKIDYFILSHPHSDHIGGAETVLSQFEIGAVYMPNAVHTSRTFEKLLQTLKQDNLPVHRAEAGVTIEIDSAVDMTFVSPKAQGYEDLNNASAVLRVTYGEKAFLFAGDAEELAEQDMIKSGLPLKAHVLKVGHHGSSTSSCTSFLKAVSPEVAIISAGIDNDYGHPHRETLESLNKLGVNKILRTDESGTIIISTDGKKIW